MDAESNRGPSKPHRRLRQVRDLALLVGLAAALGWLSGDDEKPIRVREHRRRRPRS